ncbi:hypothetical protein [Pannonibacter phragmitetus]|uniref:hypothetical protein n=1 Tax=Pannonibacter phragmitetus TaxID=121719 RepID=UPI0011C039BD|nr:hypothetical protein [Pannonibacter phragmitetus]
MYENLEDLNTLGGALFERLAPVAPDQILELRRRWSDAPSDYFEFLQERGCGDIKENEFSFPLLTVWPYLISAAKDYFGDDSIYKDGPYEPGAKGEIWLFGSDSTGAAIGFDSGDNWRLLEVDNMRWITRLDLSFRQFIEGLLVCYPQRPVRFSDGVWYDSGEVAYKR